MAQRRGRTYHQAACPVRTTPSLAAKRHVRVTSTREDGPAGDRSTPPAYGCLHAALRASRFRVTAEIGPPRGAAEEGMWLAVGLVHAMRETPGVAGVHVMAFGNEPTVGELVERSGLPRPAVMAAEGDR